jgi:SAM-dependent methyltransferase
MNEIYKDIILGLLTGTIWIICFFALYLLIKVLTQPFYWYWVPFVPSSDNKVKKLVEILKLKKWQKFLDLWCWDWKILEAVKENYPESHVYWIENSPSPYNLALKRKQNNKLDYTITRKNFFNEDFSQYDVIYSYMISYLMKKIWKKIKKECKPWTLFYSSEFVIKWEKYYDMVHIKNEKYKGDIYIYKV